MIVSDHSNLDTVLKTHAPLVKRLAYTLMSKIPPNTEIDDLIQVGMISLVDAHKRYDPTQNVKFETFATVKIKGAMIDELRASDWMSRGDRSAIKATTAAIIALSHKLGRLPANQEVASYLEIPLDAYLKTINSHSLIYLEDMKAHGSTDDDADNFLDRNMKDSHPAPLDELLEIERRQQVLKAITMLDQRERRVLELIYDDDMIYKDIGAILGISEVRVAQLHKQAISRLSALVSKTGERPTVNETDTWFAANVKGFF